MFVSPDGVLAMRMKRWVKWSLLVALVVAVIVLFVIRSTTACGCLPPEVLFDLTPSPLPSVVVP